MGNNGQLFSRVMKERHRRRDGFYALLSSVSPEFCVFAVLCLRWFCVNTGRSGKTSVSSTISRALWTPMYVASMLCIMLYESGAVLCLRSLDTHRCWLSIGCGVCWKLDRVQPFIPVSKWVLETARCYTIESYTSFQFHYPL